MLLTTIENPVFKVSTRSVRDRYTLLVKKYKAWRSAEEIASCISPDHTEIDDAIPRTCWNSLKKQIIVERLTKMKRPGEQLVAAQEIRNASLEIFSQTWNRKESEPCTSDEKRRRSSNDVLGFLSEKCEKDHALKQEEFCIKQQEIDLQKQQIIPKSFGG